MTFPDWNPGGKSLPKWYGKDTELPDRKDEISSENLRKPVTRNLASIGAKWLALIRRSEITARSSKSLSRGEETTNTRRKSLDGGRDQVSIESFRLLDLPRELRDRVYASMINDPGGDPCNRFQPPDGKSFATRPLFYNLEYNACMLAVNRQIQREFAQMLCIKKAQSGVPAVMTPLDEYTHHNGKRGPFYYKLHQPFSLNIGHLAYFSTFIEFLQSIEVRLEFHPLPGRTRWDPEVTIPDDVGLNVTEPLVAALRDGKNLRSVCIRLYLSSGRFELGWVSREMERFNAIPGFEAVQLDMIQVMGKSMSMTHTLWAIPRPGGIGGWDHLRNETNFFYKWQPPHAQGLDVSCFECWRDAQRAGYDSFPDFEGGEYDTESFLKLKRLRAPEFTWDEWKEWKIPDRRE